MDMPTRTPSMSTVTASPPGATRVGLAFGHPAGDIDVEQMDLPVRGGERTGPIEDQGSVVRTRGIRTALMERPGDDPHAQPPRSVGKRRRELAIDRLRFGPPATGPR